MSSDSPTIDDYFAASEEYSDSDKQKIPEKKRAKLDAKLAEFHSTSSE